MKKSLLLLVFALCSVMTFSACDLLGGGNSSESSSSVASEVESEVSESVEESDPEEDESSADEVEEKVTVTFSQVGEVDKTIELTKGEGLSEEDIPAFAEKVGYTVIWDLENVDLTNIQEDITINAKETANTYTITYDAGDGVVAEATKTVAYDSDVEHPVPVLTDWEFVSWTYEGAAVLDGVWKIASDVTLVAQWTDQRPSYTVTFVQGAQSQSVVVKKGESVAAADVPALVEIAGYDVAWNINDYSNIQSDMTVTAVYTAKTYTITYKAEGFDIDGTTTNVVYGDAYSLAVLEKDGYNFLGWSYAGSVYTSGNAWNIAGNVELTASWSAMDQVNITFVNTNGNSSVRSVYSGENLTDLPAIEAKVGYDVDTANWYLDAECTQVASFTNLTENMTVYAKATPKTYTITFNANGGNAVENKQVTYDAAYTLPTPTRDGYWEFAGWMNDQGLIITDGTWTTDASITLTAQWTDTRQDFTVTFKQAGQENKIFNVKQGDNFTSIPDVVAKTGYNVAWETVNLSNIQSNITVNAVETAKTYLVSYNANGGDCDDTMLNVTYDKAIGEMSIPTRTGYTFKYWTYNGQKIDENYVWQIDGDVELVADWTAKTYTITLDADGGSCATTMTVTFNAAIGEIPTPTRTGYTFNGWTYNGQSIDKDFVWTIDDGATFKASWTKNTTEDDQWTNNY